MVFQNSSEEAVGLLASLARDGTPTTLEFPKSHLHGTSWLLVVTPLPRYLLPPEAAYKESASCPCAWVSCKWNVMTWAGDQLKTNGCLIFKSGPSRFPGFGDRVSQGLPACGLHGRLAWGLGYILLVQLIPTIFAECAPGGLEKSPEQTSNIPKWCSLTVASNEVSRGDIPRYSPTWPVAKMVRLFTLAVWMLPCTTCVAWNKQLVTFHEILVGEWWFYGILMTVFFWSPHTWVVFGKAPFQGKL